MLALELFFIWIKKCKKKCYTHNYIFYKLIKYSGIYTVLHYWTCKLNLKSNHQIISTKGQSNKQFKLCMCKSTKIWIVICKTIYFFIANFHKYCAHTRSRRNNETIWPVLLDLTLKHLAHSLNVERQNIILENMKIVSKKKKGSSFLDNNTLLSKTMWSPHSPKLSIQ